MSDSQTTIGAETTGSLVLRATRCFLLGVAFGTVVLLAATATLGDQAAARALGIAGPLVGWRIALMDALPLWIALFISNGTSATIVMVAGPAGCMMEVWLQRRSPVYAHLCRRTSRSGSAVNRLDARIARLGDTPGRDGVAVAFLAPMAFLFVNGFVMGAVGVIYAHSSGPGIIGFVAAVAPHGIVELPTLILTGVVGLVSASILAEAALAGADLRTCAVMRLRSRALGVDVVRVLLLLLAAAILEGIVTPRVMELVP